LSRQHTDRLRIEDTTPISHNVSCLGLKSRIERVPLLTLALCGPLNKTETASMISKVRVWVYMGSLITRMRMRMMMMMRRCSSCRFDCGCVSISLSLRLRHGFSMENLDRYPFRSRSLALFVTHHHHPPQPPRIAGLITFLLSSGPQKE